MLIDILSVSNSDPAVVGNELRVTASGRTIIHTGCIKEAE